MSEPLDLFGHPIIHRSAYIAGDCRYSLSRKWGPGPLACVIGHNPSTADGLQDDPTTRWWNAWFALFGFGGYVAVNLYPWRSSDPAEVYRRVDGIDGGDWGARDDLYYSNLECVTHWAKAADQVFVCWGAIARECQWLDHVIDEIQNGEGQHPDLWCWGKTASGAPKHPMARGAHRIAPDQKPILWRAA
ncbi:DUF1643 domain-containing protein [Novosphingobium sp.]|uniref:DUF1643 domain-containing protein n=1 Tax=Novosphingobium sp. TaxID=1874826 RepID=UPI001D91D111|nr:DUF1643 domain-containing protein [Novosphingobium sp.]MBX9661888.1 DUF1643 domain-containing protein [Novosphingobium sp.]